MNFKKTTQVTKSFAKSHKGFTLVEMLVVIAIIAILASISFPLVNSLRDKGKVTETKIRMKEFEAAVEAYNDENGRLPYPGDSYPGGEVLSPNDIRKVVEILLGMETVTDPVNESGKKYLLMPDAKNGKNGVVYTDEDKNTIESITDAWGNEYGILIDYNRNREISQSTSTDTDTIIESKSVIIISKGINQAFNGSDDLYSWK